MQPRDGFELFVVAFLEEYGQTPNCPLRLSSPILEPYSRSWSVFVLFVNCFVLELLSFGFERITSQVAQAGLQIAMWLRGLSRSVPPPYLACLVSVVNEFTLQERMGK